MRGFKEIEKDIFEPITSMSMTEDDEWEFFKANRGYSLVVSLSTKNIICAYRDHMFDDAVAELRKRYGRDIGIHGGLPKETNMLGGLHIDF